MTIVACSPGTLETWVRLRHALWPDYSEDQLRANARQLLERGTDHLALLCHSDEGEAIGFAEASLRRDHVNGCDTSPVAFLEGIYVAPAHRGQGVARALTERIAEWGRVLACTEFASDALLENTESHAFHAAMGFEETERVVYFRRRL